MYISEPQRGKSPQAKSPLWESTGREKGQKPPMGVDGQAAGQKPPMGVDGQEKKAKSPLWESNPFFSPPAGRLRRAMATRAALKTVLDLKRDVIGIGPL